MHSPQENSPLLNRQRQCTPSHTLSYTHGQRQLSMMGQVSKPRISLESRVALTGLQLHSNCKCSTMELGDRSKCHSLPLSPPTLPHPVYLLRNWRAQKGGRCKQQPWQCRAIVGVSLMLWASSSTSWLSAAATGLLINTSVSPRSWAPASAQTTPEIGICLKP